MTEFFNVYMFSTIWAILVCLSVRLTPAHFSHMKYELISIEDIMKFVKSPFHKTYSKNWLMTES